MRALDINATSEDQERTDAALCLGLRAQSEEELHAEEDADCLRSAGTVSQYRRAHKATCWRC